jgi:5'-nucleotidase
LHEALENSVSQYPKLEGRFPQIAGIRFKFDASKPPGTRIKQSDILIQGKLIDYNHVTIKY